MNAFEKFDAERMRRRQNLVLAWIQFRSAVISSVESFNKMEEGLANPAKPDDSLPDLISVNCKRRSASGAGMLSIVAKMTFTKDRRVAIVARVEFWSIETEPPSSQGTETFEFIVELEPEGSLSFEGETLTASEAADIVLMRAFLGLPERQNIAAVNKHSRDAALKAAL